MDYGQQGNYTEQMTFQCTQNKKTGEKQQVHKLPFTERTVHKRNILNNKIQDQSKKKVTFQPTLNIAFPEKLHYNNNNRQDCLTADLTRYSLQS